eukprot:COSAG04_NODE_1596_length_6206_cov_5.650074_5_plen_53_part_00
MKFGDFRRNFGQDELVESHRQQIDDIMELVKEEMEVLRMVDTPVRAAGLLAS